MVVCLARRLGGPRTDGVHRGGRLDGAGWLAGLGRAGGWAGWAGGWAGWLGTGGGLGGLGWAGLGWLIRK